MQQQVAAPFGERQALGVPARRLGLSLATWQTLGWALVFGLAFVRAPHALLRPAMWAEDAVVFFDHARRFGASSLLQPNAGYLHFLPRLVAWVGTRLPAAWAPCLYAWSAFGCGLLTLWFLGKLRLRGLRQHGFLLAAGMVLLPHLSHEVFWHLTNIQWTVSLFLVALLFSEFHAGGSVRWGGVVFVFVSGLSSPISAVLLPFSLAAFLGQRRSRKGVLLASLLAAGFIQLWVIVGASAPTAHPGLPGFRFLMELLGTRVLVQGFVPCGFWKAVPVWSPVLAMVALLVWASVLVWAASLRLRFALIVSCVLTLLLASVLRLDTVFRDLLLDRGMDGAGDRYFLCPRFLVWAGFLLVVVRVERPFIRKCLLVAGLCLMTSASLGSFVAPRLPRAGWSAGAASLDHHQATVVPINPEGWLYRYEP